MAVTASSPAPLTAAQLASMDVSSRNAYFNSLPNQQQQDAMAAYQSYQATMNKIYMAKSHKKELVLTTPTGSFAAQTFAQGTTLTFTVPTTNNGFLHKLVFRVLPTYTLAAGTGATYAVTAAGVLAFISRIVVSINNTQFILRPYILQDLYRLMGRGFMSMPTAVIAGNSDTNVNNYLNQTAAANVTTVGAMAPVIEFELPLNFINPLDVRGILPIMAGETNITVSVDCCQSILGNDAILNPIYPSGGTGNAVSAVGGTVAVYGMYRDGTNYDGPAPLAPDLTGLATTQSTIDTGITNLLAGSINSQRPTVMDKIAYMFLTVVDGVTPAAFSSWTNLQVIQLAKDAAGQNLLWKVGVGTNLDVREWARELRNQFQQDMRPGVLPMVYSPGTNIPDPDNQDGVAYLNTSTNGWPDLRYGVQVGTVSNSLMQPRVECHLFWLNSLGLQFKTS